MHILNFCLTCTIFVVLEQLLPQKLTAICRSSCSENTEDTSGQQCSILVHIWAEVFREKMHVV